MIENIFQKNDKLLEVGILGHVLLDQGGSFAPIGRIKRNVDMDQSIALYQLDNWNDSFFDD